MRLLITVPSLAAEHGGPSVSALRTAEHVAALGANVAIVYGEKKPSASSHGSNRVQRVPITVGSRPVLFQYPRYQLSLMRASRQFAPDVVYDFGAWLPQNIASFVATRNQRAPWVSSPRGMLEPWPLSDKKLRKRIAWGTYQGAMLRNAAALVATSEGECENLRVLVSAVPIWVVPNGVDLPDLVATAAPTGPRQALFLSRLHPKKQPDLLIRLWAGLRPANWRLIIAGPGPDAYRNDLQRLIDEQGTGVDITLADAAYGDQKNLLLRSSHLFVLPTLSENFGIVVAEALAHALPVVTTTATPWRRIKQDGCGWCVEPTADAIAAALRAACGLSHDDLTAMGAKGLRVAREYSWSESARILLEHCEALLASRRQI